MWKTEHRRAADRRGLRYSSDLIDAEWALLEPMIPRPRDVNVREVLNAIFYVLSTSCQWHRGSQSRPACGTPCSADDAR